MVWLTWRQWRAQAVTALAVFGALGAVLAYTGPHLVHLYQASGITECQQANGDCSPLIDAFKSHYPLSHVLGSFLVVLPAILGVFWGAPLVARELEARTSDVAWTQAVSRNRWLATKLVMIGVGALVITGGFMAIIAAWSSPLDKVSGNRFAPTLFSQRGLAPFAYTAFAFAFGVLLGALIRRVLPAMGATLAGVVGGRVVVEQWIRPHFATPLHITRSLLGGRDGATVGSGAWVVSTRIVDAAGRTLPIGRGLFRDRCGLPESEFSRSAAQACVQRLGIHGVITYQPGNRYWSFQIWESTIFAALGVACVIATFVWVRRRLA